MAPMQNGEKNPEIQEEGDHTRAVNSTMTLNDLIQIYVSPAEKELIALPRHEDRLLDFLKAHPSKDWFYKFGIVGRFAAFAFLHRPTIQNNALPPELEAGGGRVRFRVPFVRKINWLELVKYCKNWIKHPMNMALLVWLLFVGVGLVFLGLLMTGLLNTAIPKSSQRNRWTEITNQILNALFTIMCIYQHPRLFHHFFLLCSWSPSDAAELRKVYSKTAARQPYERIHMSIVIGLLHITCFGQYALCALYWGFASKTRPSWAENLCVGIGTVAPVIAGLYSFYSPLGRKPESEAAHEISMTSISLEENTRMASSQRLVVTSPEWVGGLFDCCDDSTVACSSFFCTICVFGWNMERLGFGNMYVHIATFALLLVAPFLVFSVAALNISDETVKYAVGIVGIALCFFGLLYGGFWRTQLRKRFKLPKNGFCCGSASVSDFIMWLFCWGCAVAQEVRTGNFYDVEEDGFRRKVEDGGALAALSRDDVSFSSETSMETATDRSVDCLSMSINYRSHSKSGEDDSLRPPLQPLVELELQNVKPGRS